MSTYDSVLPAVRVSSLPARHVSLWPGERPAVACPTCDRWRMLRRGSRLTPHRRPCPDCDTHRPPTATCSTCYGDGTINQRCPSSNRRVDIDLDPYEWLAQLRIAEHDAGTRTGRWTARRITATGTCGRKFVRRVAQPTTATPTHRLATTTG